MVQKIHPRGVIGVPNSGPYVKRFQIRELLSKCSILEPSLDILKLNAKSKAKIQIVNIMKLLNSSFFLTTLGTYDMINLMGASQPRQGRPNFFQIWLNISASIIQIKLRLGAQSVTL